MSKLLRTVGEKDDGLCLCLVLRLRNISLKTSDSLDMANGSAFVDTAREAARGHSHACRHDENCRSVDLVGVSYRTEQRRGGRLSAGANNIIRVDSLS